MISPTPLLIRDPGYEDCLSYGRDEGIFFLYDAKDKRVKLSHHCREELAWDWVGRSVYLGIVLDRDINLKMLDICWGAIERKLGLGAPSVIHTVKHGPIDDEDAALYDDEDELIEGALEPKVNPKVVILKLSPFWVKSAVHKAFCSLFLRLAVCHYKGIFKTAVQRYDLASRMPNAINRFLGGYTVPNLSYVERAALDSGAGLVDMFAYEDDDPTALQRMLVKPAV